MQHIIHMALFSFCFGLQEAVMKLMGEVCDFMPDRYKDQCHDFINTYGKEIIDFLLSSAAPHTICAVLHLCLFKDTSGTGELHGCI